MPTDSSYEHIRTAESSALGATASQSESALCSHLINDLRDTPLTCEPPKEN